MENPLRNLLQMVVVVLLGAVSASQAAPELHLDWQLYPSFAPMAGGGGDTGMPVVSADGRFVLFSSTANNLVLTSSNTPIPVSAPAALNVYLRDRASNATLLVSADLAGTGGSNGDSLPVAISTNGQFVLFESAATNLVANDTNGVSDIFVRDVISNVTVLVSVGTNGFSGNGVSRNAAMTPDARHVAFASAATDLAAGDTNQNFDVFVRDLVANSTTLVSVGSPPVGNLSYSILSDSPAISSDGRYVAFFSAATNLIPRLAGPGDVYLRDLTLGTTTWVSTNALAMVNAIAGPSWFGAITCVSCNFILSADGDYVAFEALAKHLSYPSASPLGIVLRHHPQTGVTDLITTNAHVPLGSIESFRTLDMSADGRFIAFVGNLTNVPFSPPTTWYSTNTAIHLWDAQAATNVLVSVDWSTGLPAKGICTSPAVSAAGRYVAFVSDGTNYVTNALSSGYHAYLRDLQAGTTFLADARLDGFGPGVAGRIQPSMSADSQILAFETFEANLVPGDTNSNKDVFVYAPGAASAEWISLNDAALPGAGPTISWLTNGLPHYQVQFKYDLNEADWQDAPGGVAIYGKRGYFTDIAPSSVQKFYRVIAY